MCWFCGEKGHTLTQCPSKTEKYPKNLLFKPRKPRPMKARKQKKASTASTTTNFIIKGGNVTINKYN